MENDLDGNEPSHIKVTVDGAMHVLQLDQSMRFIFSHQHSMSL